MGEMGLQRESPTSDCEIKISPWSRGNFGEQLNISLKRARTTLTETWTGKIHLHFEIVEQQGVICTN